MVPAHDFLADAVARDHGNPVFPTIFGTVLFYDTGHKILFRNSFLSLEPP